MKRIKSLSILTIFTLIWSMFSFITPVYAAGTATVGFSGDSTVSVGSNITLKLYISNVSGANGGIASVGGNLSFDSEYLEYVSGTGATTPYSFQINPSADYIIAGLDTSLSNGITGSGQTTVFTFVFKAKKIGSTTVTVKNAKLTDTSDRVTTTVNDKTITITEATPSKSSDATLKSLSASGYSLSPSFSSSTTSYIVKVPSSTTTVKLEGAVNDNKATVNGLGNVTLTGDTTTASIKVTAEDGTTKTYTVKIVKETETTIKSSDATLKSLSASGYSLSPSFSSSTTSYTIKVPSSATTVKLEGVVNDSKATVNGLGNITLTGDTTTTSIKVTAEDGTTKTYTVKIVKEEESTIEKDSDATLKKLDVSGYTLSPIFKKNVTTYSMKVKNNITSLEVTAIPTSNKAKATVTGNKNWKEGVNTITVKVTAEDGSTNTYIVNVTRASSDNKTDSSVDKKSSDNYLKSLTINSSHEIDKKFSKNVSSYNITVPYEVDELELSYVTNDSKAKVKVLGNDNFKVGEVNTVEVEVTAEDGSTRIYTLNVTRSTQESNTDLKDLVIEGATLSPKFDPNTLEYTTKVGSSINQLNIQANAKTDGSKVEIIGNDNLKEGHNTVLVKVTDKNGFTKYYTIDVEKEAQSKIFGLTVVQFGIISGIIVLLLLGLLLLLLKRRIKEEKKVQELEKTQSISPIIEIKPEFNFGSKNNSDDDIVHGNFNQDSDLSEKEYKQPKQRTIEASYEEHAPYDLYDQTVTKREIIDAIHEATKTKDPSKLKMLLDQDELNQRKKEIRRKEEERKRREQEESDDWRN